MVTDISDPIVTGDKLAVVRRRTAALEQMCAVVAREVASLAADVTELVERPSAPSLSVSVDEAARLLGIGRSTLFTLMESGAIRSVKVGTRRLVPRVSLEEFLARHDDLLAG